MQNTTFSRIFVGLMAMLLCIHPLVACNTSHEPDPYQTVGEIAGQPVALGITAVCRRCSPADQQLFQKELFS